MDSDHRGGGPTIPPQQCGLGKEHDDSSIIIPDVRRPVCGGRAGVCLRGRMQEMNLFDINLFSIG
jgi:hypothetical protein